MDDPCRRMRVKKFRNCSFVGDDPDGVVAEIADVQVVRTVSANSSRPIERGEFCRTVLTPRNISCTGNCGYLILHKINPSNAIVSGVRNEQQVHI